MQRDLEMVIRIPKEMEQDFRLLIVLHGGQIVETKDCEEKTEAN
jgi:cysteine synthase